MKGVKRVKPSEECTYQGSKKSSEFLVTKCEKRKKSAEEVCRVSFMILSRFHLDMFLQSPGYPVWTSLTRAARMIGFGGSHS